MMKSAFWTWDENIYQWSVNNHKDFGFVRQKI